jgi:hypothetical protein
MNKFYVILSGSVAGALAAGGAGGYLFAKKQFDKKIDGLIAREVAETRKFYSLQIMQLKENKPATPGELLAQKEQEREEEAEPEPSDEEILLEQEAAKAATNYRGYSKSESDQTNGSQHNNIFSDSAKPPRNFSRDRGADGKFLPKQHDQRNEPPEIIDEDTFLSDDEFEEENLKFFMKENELLDYANESVDIAKVGEVNLTLFPEVEEGKPSVIFVRNHGLAIKYEILRMDLPLAEYMGFGDVDSLEEGDLNYH